MLLFSTPIAEAQVNDVSAQRLPITPTVPAPQDGHYFAGDEIEFWVDHKGVTGNARLRFVGDDEIFYLTTDPATLGGRVLKYDSGDIALAVSSWGGVTLYTRETPNGIPAQRIGEAPDLDPTPLPARELEALALEATQALEGRAGLDVDFIANWESVTRSNRVRNLTIESMRNASNALAELANKAETRSAHVEDIRLVRIVVSDESAIRIENQALIILFDANGEPWERPSSRAIVEAIENLPQ